MDFHQHRRGSGDDAKVANRQYDGLDRLTDEQTAQGEVGYSYDAAGRRTAMTVAGQNAVGYTWDNANRLTAIAQGSSSVGLAYDNVNRRTTLTLPNGVAVAYTYDSDSRVTGLTYTMAARNWAIWAILTMPTDR